MAGEHFQVHPPTVAGLANKFHTESQGLTKQVADFGSSAADIGEAFGLLGACDGAMQKYLTLFQSTSRALGRLSQVLDANGQRLTATAASYTSVDQTVADHAKSVNGAV